MYRWLRLIDPEFDFSVIEFGNPIIVSIKRNVQLDKFAGRRNFGFCSCCKPRDKNKLIVVLYYFEVFMKHLSNPLKFTKVYDNSLLDAYVYQPAKVISFDINRHYEIVNAKTYGAFFIGGDKK